MFRVPRGARWVFVAGCTTVGVVATFVVAIIPVAILVALYGAGSAPVMFTMKASTILGGVLGLAYGVRSTGQLWDFCSDPSCGAELPPHALECPRCTGRSPG